MKAASTLLFALFLSFTHGYSQQTRTTFTIQGTTKSPDDSGRMILININTEDYYPFHGTMETTVRNGRFSFTDSILYPTAYRIGFKPDSVWKFVSGAFFVEPGKQALSYNTDESWKIPTIENRSMLELHNDYKTYFASYNSQYDRYLISRDSLYGVYKGKKIPDSIRHWLASGEKEFAQKYQHTLLSYIKKDPGSYVALWMVVGVLSSGYEPFCDTLYNALSDAIRETHTAKVLKHKLEVGSLSCIGCRFPAVKFAPIGSLSRKVSLSPQFSKYTLIDFWFSHCPPCIEQIPKFKELYARYKDSGFQLIGVSTDRTNYIQNWKKIIKENTLPWPQYLDENAAVADALSILSFPSNFLVDEKGVIIQKNISPEYLEVFLGTNIRQ